jgi:ribonuclease HI
LELTSQVKQIGQDNQIEKNDQGDRGDRDQPQSEKLKSTQKSMQASGAISSIHTDGACSKNPGPGGWGVVVHFDDGEVTELGGRLASTTNNQMELQAAISALEFLAQQKNTTPVDLYTDSKYVIDGITKWIKGWKRNGWQTKDKKPVKNQELWQALDLLNSANVRWHWVEGHSGDPDNERCDAIARAYTFAQNPDLRLRK